MEGVGVFAAAFLGHELEVASADVGGGEGHQVAAGGGEGGFVDCVW